MNVIKGVLKEELRNSLKVKKAYEKELSKLPKGSLVRAKRKGHKYYYLVFREKGKVRLVYKGKLSDSKVKKYHEAKKLRVKYRNLLSQVKKEIKFLEKSLKSGKKTS